MQRLGWLRHGAWVLATAAALVPAAADAQFGRGGGRNPAILDPRTAGDFARPFIHESAAQRGRFPSAMADSGVWPPPATHAGAALAAQRRLRQDFHPGFHGRHHFGGGFFNFGFHPGAGSFFGYGGGGFYPFSGLGGYGYGYAPYLPPSERVYVERQLYVLPQGGGGAERYQAPERDRERESDRDRDRDRRPQGEDDFYLSRRPGGEPLQAALEDIRRAWTNGDPNRLSDRFPADSQVRLFPNGKYAYSLAAAEFRKLTRDAIAGIETKSFEFEPVKEATPDRAFVTGKHTFLAPDPVTGSKEERQVYISYRLQFRAGRWRITEAGSSPKPIAGHEE